VPAARHLGRDLLHLADSLFDGRRFRALTVIDEWTRECLAVEVDVSLTGARVVKVTESSSVSSAV